METDDRAPTSENLTLAAATETVAATATYSQLIELIVEVAARVINATTASLLLLDRAAQELVFTVAYPHRVADLAPFRVRVGEGIAGLVAFTGQPMAIADARQDPRHASTVAQQTGYQPDSLLCAPLVFTDEVVGVLELMDKRGASSFDSNDMQTLGLFARLAAVAIEQSRTRSSVASLLLHQVPPVTGVSGEHAHIAEVAASLEHEPRFQRTLELAKLVNDIAQAGDAEAEACAGILRHFAAYVRSRPRVTAE